MSGTGDFSQRCPALRKDGTQCRGIAIAGSVFCFAHDPTAQENRAKGGRASRRSARALRLLPERLRPTADLLAQALDEVHAGTLDPRAATAMAALASALVRVVQSGELEQRVRDLESAANAASA